MKLKFLLREDMPVGFKNNPYYPELPAVFEFLKAYEGKTFKTKAEFETELGKFQDYLKRHQIPKGSDKALREGLLVKAVKDTEKVFNIVTRSSENASGYCWFGSLGFEEDLGKYFQAQEDARKAQIIENDDELG